MNIVLLGYPNRLGVPAAAEEIKKKLDKSVNILCEDFAGTKDLSQYTPDAVVVLGGDGSILRAVGQMGETQRPIIAVNLGRLGFLADVTTEEIAPLLKNLNKKPLPIISLMMYQCRILRNGKELKVIQGVNETAILNGAPFSIMEIKLHVERDQTEKKDVKIPFDQKYELVTTYSCDGLIISTPVGSTAHSLSSGGPILHKTMQAFVVCPIAAHTLTNRPIIEESSRVFLMEVANPTKEACVVTDGQPFHYLESGDWVEVRKSPLSVQMVAPPDKNYYQTLRDKLGWSGQPLYQR